MAKNDFDIDFDFEEEDNFDPKAFLDDEGYDKDIDLNSFSDEELGLRPQDGNFDLDEDLDTEDFLNLSEQEDEEEDWDDEEETEEADEAQPEDLPAPAVESEEEFSPEEDYAEAEYDPEEAETEETDMNEEEMDYAQEAQEESYEEGYEEEYAPEGEEEYEEEEAPRKRKPMPKITLPKLHMPKFLTKFYDVYFAPVLHKELQDDQADPSKPRRRRKTKRQLFKEYYLPPILACLCLILVLSFVIGSLSNTIALKQIEEETRKNQLDASISQAELEEQQINRIVAEAESLATGYDYQGAIDLLKSINGGDLTSYPDIGSKVSEYTSTMNQLVEHKEPSLIPNLSFHVLVTDMAKALQNKELGGSYNKNFVTIDEFSKILNELYNNGYVLVDFDSFVGSSTTLEGTEKFEVVPIKLPDGKKPVMITETMVNYFEYMVDGNGDHIADSQGDGFANKLVLDASGNIKAEYIDSQGQTNVGNYDLIPILEDFIAQHPDFCYQGARATIAFTGSQGVFGYRCNTSYIGTMSQDYYDEQVAGAQQIANALREKGYTLACYTYSNDTYAKYSVAQISANLTSWTTEVTNVIGAVDTFVFARLSNITDFNSQAFNVMYQSGFRYFIGHGSTPSAQVNTTYVRQNRLMVTGENMAHYPSQFTDLNLFNPNSVLDLTTRGNIPKSS